MSACFDPQGAIAKLPKKTHLNTQQNLGTYIGGSLPNVNQIGSSNAIDLQVSVNELTAHVVYKNNVTDSPISLDLWIVVPCICVYIRECMSCVFANLRIWVN